MIELELKFQFYYALSSNIKKLIFLIIFIKLHANNKLSTMDNRIDVRIAVIGEPKSGKETFCKMLFLDSASRIRLNPLSELGEIYMEIDPDNFKNSTRNIIKECTDQNNLIMKQTQITNLEELRKNNINPFFYRYSRRICGLINENEPGRINRNVLLTFHFIGNNYKNFTREINSANIIIYLMDINKKFDPTNEMFGYLINTIKNSSGTKFMIPIINKYDSLNSQNIVDNKFTISCMNIDTNFREIIQKNNLQDCLLEPISMTAKYAMVFRMVYHKVTDNVEPEVLDYLSKTYDIDTDNAVRDICKNGERYFDKCGYNAFRMAFMKILNKNYRNMIGQNLTMDINQLEKYISNTNEFNILFQSIQHRSDKMNKIFKMDYYAIILNQVKIIFDKIVQMEKPNVKIIDRIHEHYGNLPDLMVMIRATKELIRDKFIDNVINRKDMKMDSFLPSHMSVEFEQIINMYPSKVQVARVVKHICEMYSCGVKNLLMRYDRDTILMLYNTYFTERETMAMMSMLNEIKSLIDYDDYKNYLLQIFLAKLQIAECIVENKSMVSQQILSSIISYCKSLRMCISENTCRKYDYLFINVLDICTKIILEMNSVSNARYLSENIVTILGFKPDKIINLDKFIIKMIKKTNYQAVVNEDDINTDDDTDVDIYGEEDSPEDENEIKFNITEEDLAESSDEDTDFF